MAPRSTTPPARLVAFTVLVILVGAAAGCGLFATSIGDIQAKPQDFIGREVTVAGEVTNTMKLPFLPGFYTVKDKTGEISVFAGAQPPALGARVRVKGRVEAAATIGGQSFGVHIRESSGT